MSRIVLATFGSLGDLHPFLALGEALVVRGAAVTVAASESYRPRVRSLGLDFAPLSPDLARWERDERAMRAAMDLRFGSRWIMENMALPAIEANARELDAALEGADVLVHSTLVLAAGAVAESRGVPRVAVTLQPLAMFSARDPAHMPIAPALSCFLRGRPAFARALLALLRAASRTKLGGVERLRRARGLAGRGPNPLFDPGTGAAAHLALFSPHFAADPGDWAPNTRQPGFAFHDHTPEHPDLPAPLRAFLEAGEPPLVFTLGSSAVWVAGGFFAHADAAARALGRRAVLLVGEGPAPGEPHRDVFVGAYAPYSKLFPHAAAVVHQGGVGTTAQALRAGRPQLVVPWSHDQPDNAERCARLGVARVLARARADAGAMTRELGALLADVDVAARAETLGRAIRAEDGAGAAADVVLAVAGGAAMPR